MQRNSTYMYQLVGGYFMNKIRFGSFAFLALFCCSQLSIIAGQEKGYSRWDNFRDQVIGCLHWIACPYCVKDKDRQRKNFRAAIEQNKPDVIEHIVRRRFTDPNEQFDEFKLPIVMAAEKGNAEAVKMLLKLGANVNGQLMDRSGYKVFPSALIAACASENPQDKDFSKRIAATVQVLIDHGADPRLSCIWQTASENEEIEKVIQDRKHNRSVSPVSILRVQSWLNEERTAIDFAIKNKYIDALAILRKALENGKRDR